MSEYLQDPAVIVATISVIVAGISFIGTVVVALVGFKSTQVGASDEIASGATALLVQYRQELTDVQTEVKDLKSWRDDVTDFIVPFIEGSKKNERQIINAGMVPAYNLPPLPEWLGKE